MSMTENSGRAGSLTAGLFACAISVLVAGLLVWLYLGRTTSTNICVSSNCLEKRALAARQSRDAERPSAESSTNSSTSTAPEKSVDPENIPATAVPEEALVSQAARTSPPGQLASQETLPLGVEPGAPTEK